MVIKDRETAAIASVVARAPRVVLLLLLVAPACGGKHEDPPPDAALKPDSGPETSSGGVNDICTKGSNTCEAGLVCATVDKTETIGFRCFVPCTQHSQCLPSEKCQLTIYQNSTPSLACSDLCKVWSQNSCQTGQACIWSATTGAVCGTGGSAKVGQPCSRPSDCSSGTLCLNGSCMQACIAWNTGCDRTLAPCDPGKVCKQPAGTGLGPTAEDPCLGVCM